MRILRGRFNRALLPEPITVLSQLGISPGERNNRGYWKFRCPFHKQGEEIHPSLNLHYSTGHFRCHACGEKGGDILAFYMKVTGKKFIEATLSLGAWENCL